MVRIQPTATWLALQVNEVGYSRILQVSVISGEAFLHLFSISVNGHRTCFISKSVVNDLIPRIFVGTFISSD